MTMVQRILIALSPFSSAQLAPENDDFQLLRAEVWLEATSASIREISADVGTRPLGVQRILRRYSASARLLCLLGARAENDALTLRCRSPWWLNSLNKSGWRPKPSPILAHTCSIRRFDSALQVFQTLARQCSSLR